MKQPFIYLGLGLVLVIAVAFGVSNGNDSSKNSLSSSYAGKATIGGDFTLVDQNGKTVTNADFKGRYMLLFFGYTFCPDVCPTALQGVSEMMDLLGADAKRVVPLFVTVDPERDTPDVMKEYVANFSEHIVGLTGSMAQVKAASKVYRAYFAKVPSADGDPESYSMSHSTYLYLMGPDGTFLTVFGYQTSPKDMALKIKKFFQKN